MTKALMFVAMGLVVFIMADQLITTLITGTDTGSTLIQNLVALSIAIGIVVGALKIFLSGKTST